MSASARTRAALHVFKHNSPASERAPWIAVTGAARTLAGSVTGTAFLAASTPGDAAADLRQMLKRLKASAFPSEAASEIKLVEGFLAVAEAFVTAATPERRETYAKPLEQCANAVSDLLHEQRELESRPYRSRTGERD